MLLARELFVPLSKCLGLAYACVVSPSLIRADPSWHSTVDDPAGVIRYVDHGHKTSRRKMMRRTLILSSPTNITTTNTTPG